jgi:hypothetical protein
MPIGLRDYISTHLNSNSALFYKKAHKSDIYFLNTNCDNGSINIRISLASES